MPLSVPLSFHLTEPCASIFRWMLAPTLLSLTFLLFFFFGCSGGGTGAKEECDESRRSRCSSALLTLHGRMTNLSTIPRRLGHEKTRWLIWQRREIPAKRRNFDLRKWKGGEREDATDFARRNCSIMRFWRDRQNLWCDYPWVEGGGNAGNGFRKCRRRRRPNISEYLCARYNIGRGSLEIVADWKGGVLFDFFFFLLDISLGFIPIFLYPGRISQWLGSFLEGETILLALFSFSSSSFPLSQLTGPWRKSQREGDRRPPPISPNFFNFFLFLLAVVQLWMSRMRPEKIAGEVLCCCCCCCVSYIFLVALWPRLMS